jgi:glycosyltransferase involved in cell wall biosynthesis
MGITRPIIAFGGNSWDPYWQTRQHVLSRLAARGWPVVYSTGPFFVWDQFSPRWNDARWRDRTEILDGVCVYWPGRWQMRWPRFPSWDARVVHHHGRTMRRLACVADGTRPIAYLFRPSFLAYRPSIDPAATIYHADDTFSLMSHWSAADAERQIALVEQADLVVASSRRVASSLSGGGRVRLLPNGVDYEAFSNESLPCPEDLAQIPHPRISYVGFLNDKVDFKLMYEIASERPSWHWVLVGPEVGPHNFSPANAGYLIRCRALRNVHFLGKRPHTLIPNYVQHMDVNTMCYRSTPGGWWTDIYPLKLHEYLAAGKPVVSSRIDAVRDFDRVVALADSFEGWTGAINHAIQSNGVGSPEERRRVAAENSWTNRLDTLEGWLRSLPG